MKKILILCIAIMVFVVGIVPCYATTDFPAYDDVLAQYDDYYYVYMVYTTSNVNYVSVYYDLQGYHNEHGWNFQTETAGVNNILVNMKDDNGTKQSIAYMTYKHNGSSWTQLSGAENTFNAYSQLNLEGKTTMVYSDLDIYYKDGTLFFEVPSAGLAGIIQAEMMNFQTKTNQTMMIIVLCGVGCLALLISLPLLLKILKSYLQR